MASTTLTQFQQAAQAEVGFDSGNSTETTLLTKWTNEMYEDVLRRSKCRIRPFSTTLTSGTADYSLPTSVLAITELYVLSGSTQRELERLTFEELIFKRQASATAGNVRWYAIQGDMLSLYPTPGTGETLRGFYVRRPTALSGGSDVPSDVPAEFHQVIEWGLLWRANGYGERGSTAMGEVWRQRYLEGIKEMASAANQKGGRRLPTRRVRDRRHVVRDRSEDTVW